MERLSCGSAFWVRSLRGGPLALEFGSQPTCPVRGPGEEQRAGPETLCRGPRPGPVMLGAFTLLYPWESPMFSGGPGSNTGGLGDETVHSPPGLLPSAFMTRLADRAKTGGRQGHSSQGVTTAFAHCLPVRRLNYRGRPPRSCSLLSPLSFWPLWPHFAQSPPASALLSCRSTLHPASTSAPCIRGPTVSRAVDAKTGRGQAAR